LILVDLCDVLVVACDDIEATAGPVTQGSLQTGRPTIRDQV